MLGKKSVSYGVPFTRLPISTKMYRDYLMELSVEDFRKIIDSGYRFIRPSESGKAAIVLTDKFLSEQLVKVNPLVLAHELYCLAFEKMEIVSESSEFSRFCVAVLGQTINSQYKTNRLQIIKKCWEAEPKKKSIQEIQSDLNVILESYAVKQWLKSPEKADYVLGLIFDKVGEKTIELLHETAVLENPLNATEWESFISKYDEYKDTPVAWWNSLVRG